MEFNPLWMFVPAIVLILIGYPIGFVLGGVGVIFGLIFWGSDIFYMLAIRFFDLQTNYILIAVPLFILMGCILERSGAADRLYGVLHIWMGPLRGGLALATVVICTLLAAATGVAAASVTTMGLLALPEMLKRGYNTELAAGTVMSAGCLGIIIPPSVLLVMWGAWADLSVGRLFMAAVFPGLLLSALYCAYILIITGLKPKMGPALPAEERRIPLRQKFSLLLTSIIPIVFLIFAVLGTIFFGIATPTEASAMGVVGSLIIAAINRRLSWSLIKEATYRTAKVLGMIAVIAGGAYCFIGVFMGLGGVAMVKEIMLGLELGRWGTFIAMMVIEAILGLFLDWVGILMLIVPIFMPIVYELGFDPIWFSTLMCINMVMDFLTPPFGLAIFYVKGVAPTEVTMAQLIRGAIPFCILMTIGIVIVAIFPQIALWLPGVMIGE